MRTFILSFMLVLCVGVRSDARDRGQYANSDPAIKQWFETLHSENGPCCSDADGSALSDTDWEGVNDPARPQVHFRVYIEKQWWDVPDSAVIKEPNRVGRTMVWPIYLNEGSTIDITIRCFIPGAMI